MKNEKYILGFSLLGVVGLTVLFALLLGFEFAPMPVAVAISLVIIGVMFLILGVMGK